MDAPKVIRNLLVIGAILLLIALFLPESFFPPAGVIIKSTAFFPAIFLILAGLFMIYYAKAGKFKQRERILSLHQWKGDEIVLDVGTGLGLLMIGAAQKLSSGRSYGIDIFNSSDLSDNTIKQTRLNAELEKVSEKIVVREENILRTTFPDQMFDVIVSNLCIHNIYNREGREKACREIFRLLKPGGQVVISDFQHTRAYKEVFESLGMPVRKVGTYYWDTFPPLTVIAGRKQIE